MPYTSYLPAKEVGARAGRGAAQQRKVFLRRGVISQAKGSAYLEQGGTKLLAAVYGPREVAHRRQFSMRGQLTAELKFAPFSCYGARRGHQMDREEEELGLVVGEALSSTVCLHSYPKACIEVFLTVLQDDGGVLAAALTASGLALADAGIQMYDLVVGGAVSVGAGGVLLADPEREEGYTPGGGVEGEVTVGCLPSLDQVVACVAEGRLDPDTLAAALAAATEQCRELLPAVQHCLVEKIQKLKAEGAQD